MSQLELAMHAMILNEVIRILRSCIGLRKACTNFESLPKEIVEHVLSFLHYSDQLPISSVNTQFYTIIENEDVWKSRVLGYFERQQQIPSNVAINWKRLCYLIDPARNIFSKKYVGQDLVLENEQRLLYRSNTTQSRLNQNAFIDCPLKLFKKNTGDVFLYLDLIIRQHTANKISIGLAEQSFSMNSGFVGFPSFFRKKTSIGYTSDGWLRTGELPTRIEAPSFTTEDHIGIMIKKRKDMAPEMVFTVNGVTAPKAPLHELKKLDVYYPAVTLYHPEDKVELCSKIMLPLSVMIDFCREFVVKNNEIRDMSMA